MKKIVLILSIISTLSLQAQKTAFINESKMLKATPGYELSLKETDSLKKTLTTEIKQTKDRLNQKINQLLAPYKVTDSLSYKKAIANLPEVEKNKLDLLLEENKLIEKQVLAKEREFASFYDAKMGKILEKVNKLVKDYCVKNKIDVLYKIDIIQPTLAYYDEKKDITEILLKLNKQ